MPKIVRPGGLNLVNDIVKIRDLGAVTQVRPQPPPDTEPEDAVFVEARLPEEGTVPESGAAEFEPGAAGPAVEAPTGVATGVREQIIQSAMSEAGRILEDAVKQAEKTRAEQLAGMQQEAEALRQKAMEEGRAEGRQLAVDEVKQAANDLEGAVARFEGDRAGFEAEYETQLKWLAIEIASKVLAKKVSEDDAEMLEMVQKAVQSVKNEPWIHIEVAQEMTRLIDRLTEVYEDYANVEVGAIPAEPGTVQIETPAGVVDASLRTQLANLREYFAQNRNSG